MTTIMNRQQPPTIREEDATAYAHCVDPRCPGYRQVEVEAICMIVEKRFEGPSPVAGFVENTTSHLRFADEKAIKCERCGRDRELSDTPRPTYDSLSGHDPNYLIGSTAKAFDPAVKNTEADARVAELEAQLRAQQAKLDKVLERFGEADEAG